MLKAISNGANSLKNNMFSYIKCTNFYLQTPVCSCIMKKNSPLKNITRHKVIIPENKIKYRLNYVDSSLFCTSGTQIGTLSKNEFESRCNETLDSLCEYFEEIIEDNVHLKGCDVAYSDGVLTIHFGNGHGTYVINRQSPNHQIWLSSPVSGPKRYDYVASKKSWIYRHDNRSLHELLQDEIPNIVKSEVNFLNCANAG